MKKLYGVCALSFLLCNVSLFSMHSKFEGVSDFQYEGLSGRVRLDARDLEAAAALEMLASYVDSRDVIQEQEESDGSLSDQSDQEAAESSSRVQSENRLNTQSAAKPLQAKEKNESPHIIKGVHKKWRCSTCSKEHNLLSALRRHLAVHSEERPFACQFCTKRFKLDVNVRLHERTVHSSEKPFECKKCNVSYVRNFGLQRHMSSKTHLLKSKDA